MRALAATLLTHDVRLSGRLQELGSRSARLRALAVPFARSADGWIWLLGAALVALAGTPPARRLALGVAAAILVTALVVKIGKITTRRARPVGDWGVLYRKFDPHAFPSGHTARAVLLAVLASAFGPAWLGTMLACWAVAVAASRVTLGVHYLSDVVAGAALGLVCGAVAALVIPRL
jgi:undecaprenyl-diphosphatase